MSEENVEIVRSIVANWASGDFSSVDWADPDIEFVAAHDSAESRGVDALGRRWREFLVAFDHLTTKPERFIDVGDDRVLALVRFEGRGRASGTPTTDYTAAQMFTLREGKVVRLVLSSKEEALEAAGLSE